MSRLSLDALRSLPPEVTRPAYEPNSIGVGIVHFGPGAFHRAHQAAYMDRLLEQDTRWGIAAVSLRSAGTVEALARQDGLYSLSVVDREPSIRVIGAHRAFVGPGDATRLKALLDDPAIRLVTSTVTEKGYCLAGDGALDHDHPDIAADLAHPDDPVSVIGWIVAGLRSRRDGGAAPFAVLCCDNLTGNGRKLRAAVADFARRLDPGLADWIAGEAMFPNSMVDSITPATDAAHLARAAAQLGVDDAAAVQREAFAQWVLEDMPLPGAPDLAGAGVIRTGDVRAFEQAKLRILNGAHSTLAYLGLARGHETVAEAMTDAPLAAFVSALVGDDIAPTLRPAAGLDLARYAEQILDRFRNPSIRHLLSQIAWDGSQKLPYRLLDTILDALDTGRPVDRLAVPVAAWMAFVRRMARTGQPLVDPLAGRLIETAAAARDDDELVDGLLGFDAVFPPPLARQAAFRALLVRRVSAIESGDWSAAFAG